MSADSDGSDGSYGSWVKQNDSGFDLTCQDVSQQQEEDTQQEENEIPLLFHGKSIHTVSAVPRTTRNLEFSDFDIQQLYLTSNSSLLLRRKVTPSKRMAEQFSISLHQEENKAN